MSIEGVDYSTARPNPGGLWAAGKRFVVRYGGPGSDGKHLHADELHALLAAGLSVVANAEGTQGGYRGEAAGRAYAAAADAHFRAIGMPADRPIYFSVDFNAGTSDWPAIDAALRGSATVIGPGRVGVYGGYNTIAHCATAKTARWFWQTYAWSAGRWHPENHLEQYRNGVGVAGGDCDLNRAMADDFGQWGQGDTMPTAEEIAAAVWGFDVDPSAGGYTARGALFDANKRTGSMANDKLPALSVAVTQLAASLDPAALAAGIAAALPPGTQITPAELQAAIVGALRELVGSPS